MDFMISGFLKNEKLCVDVYCTRFVKVSRTSYRAPVVVEVFMGQAQDQNFIWVVRAEGAGLGRYPIWRLSGVSDGPRGQNEGKLNFDGRTSRVLTSRLRP